MSSAAVPSGSSAEGKTRKVKKVVKTSKKEGSGGATEITTETTVTTTTSSEDSRQTAGKQNGFDDDRSVKKDHFVRNFARIP